MANTKTSSPHPQPLSQLWERGEETGENYIYFLPKLDYIESQFQSANAYRDFLEEQLKSDQLIQHLTFAE